LPKETHRLPGDTSGVGHRQAAAGNSPCQFSLRQPSRHNSKVKPWCPCTSRENRLLCRSAPFVQERHANL
jgi:hypothetical protein